MVINNIKYHKIVSNWLLTSIILVFLMIMVGGLTRLTNSGLSITEWELFKGIFPPLTNKNWITYFELYKTIPQFSLVNPLMTLEEFKVIFYWEYFHRLFGRIIGLFYILPLIFFTYKKILDKNCLTILYLVFGLILFQGFLGWYMVESGLVNKVSVSHYRLSLHLFFAFLIISILYWTYLNINLKSKKVFFNFKNKLVKLFLILVLGQIILGAFVSGLDAGMIYQTWPKMNNSYFPDDIDLNNFNLILSLNQQSYVQFLHRNLAYFITLIAIILGIKLYFIDKSEYFKNYLVVLIILFIQILLGVFTLISGLNLYLASFHQITSILLVFTVINLNYKLS